MDNFSMKLDLSNFFKDERRQSLVFIDAKWQNIKDVQDHIQNLFKLKDINLLTTDGCFLPPREAIQVLKGAPGLKAFRFSAPEENDFASPAPVTKTSKKRKYTSAEDEVEPPSSTPSRPSKRSKKKSSKVPEIPAVTSPELSIRAFEFPLRSSQNSTKYEKSNEEASASSVSGRTSSKSSRTLQNKSVVAAVSDRPSTKSSRTLINKSVEAAAEDHKTLEEEPAPQNEVLAPPPIVFRCPLMELDSNTARTFELPAKKNNVVIIENIEIKAPNGFHLEPVATKKPEATTADVDIEGEPQLADEEASELLKAEPKADSNHKQDEEPEETVDVTNVTKAETPEIEEKVEPKDILPSSVVPPPPARFCAQSLSSDSDDDDVMVLDDTNADDSDSDVQAVAPTEEQKKSRSSNIIRDMMQSSVPLDDLPNRGDSIIFKLLKVKGNPGLGFTDFIAGICNYVNRRTKVITLEIISYPSEFKRILSQYSSSLDDSGDEVKCLNVNIKDLRETRTIVDTIE
ncbi:coilin [Drosophila kikkawai]|uniref:Coilin n=1 Tax=Drosophila kikkawai TaxID=30033 RepID=A0A6P4IFX8_DROKI|nr:coilin [Drosophila kikkawai]